MKRRTFLKSLLGAVAAVLVRPFSRAKAQCWMPSTIDRFQLGIHLIRETPDSMGVELLGLYEKVVLDDAGREILVSGFASFKSHGTDWRHHVTLIPAAAGQSWSEMKIVCYDATKQREASSSKTFKVPTIAGTVADKFVGWNRVSAADARKFMDGISLGSSSHEEYLVAGVSQL